MLTLWPRPDNYSVLKKTNINTVNVKKLTTAAEKAWDGLISMNLQAFSRGFIDSFNSQVRMFPDMINERISTINDRYRDDDLAWKLSGAGGGGYLILISEKTLRNYS